MSRIFNFIAKPFRMFYRWWKGVNAYDEKGFSQLHRAVKSNDITNVERLIKSGAKIDLKTNDDIGATPLFIAVLNGYTEIVDLLIRNGADVGAQCSDGETPLYAAASTGQLEVIYQLLKKQSSIDSTLLASALKMFHDKSNAEYNTEAVPVDRQMHYASITTLLCSKLKEESKKAVIDGKNDLGCTPLHYAVLMNNGLIVQTLIENGADCNITNNAGKTPLMLALENNKEEAVLALLGNKEKANFNVEDILQIADSKGMFQVVDSLLQNESKEKIVVQGKGDNVTKSLDVSNMMFAATKGLWNYVFNFVKEKIVDNKDISDEMKSAAVNQQNSQGQSILHLAVEQDAITQSRQCSHERNDTGAVSNMLNFFSKNSEFSLKGDLIDNQGKTAFHKAVDAGLNPAILERMYSSEIATMQDKNGEPALNLHKAAKLGMNVDVIKALLEESGDENVDIAEVDNEKSTLLHLAVLGGDEDVVKFILEEAQRQNKNIIDMQDNLANTALHYAVLSKNQSIVNILRDYGARADIWNISRQRADIMARQLGINLPWSVNDLAKGAQSVVRLLGGMVSYEIPPPQNNKKLPPDSSSSKKDPVVSTANKSKVLFTKEYMTNHLKFVPAKQVDDINQVLDDEEGSLVTQHATPASLEGEKQVDLPEAVLRGMPVEEVEKIITPKNVNMIGSSGQTALFWAAMTKNQKMINMLLSKGADPDITNQSGQSARKVAEKNNLTMSLPSQQEQEDSQPESYFNLSF